MTSPIESLPKLDRRTTYERFVESEGVPVFRGFYIEDLRALEIGPWPRKGGRGCFVQLDGTEGRDDAYVCEIPPGSQLNPKKHLYEELVYVVGGRGATRIWNRQGAEVTFEWHEGSLFSIPLNTWYQHFNGSGTDPALYFAVTNAPLMMNLFHDQDFIFSSSHDFTGRFHADADFTGGGTAYDDRIWETNFVADVRSYELPESRRRGAGGRGIRFELANSSMTAHISEFPVGTYKKAHRHGPGAHVTIIRGEGYSLLWKQGEPIRRVDWRPGSVVVPPEQWFHQHFNLGAEPARYLALRWNSRKYPVFKEYGVEESTLAGGDQIEYDDEDPSIRETFEQELAKRGVTCRMPPVEWRR